MTTSLPKESRFVGAILDALTSHICVLDQAGSITLVNERWRQFAAANGSGPIRTGVGMRYVDVCRESSGFGSEGASEFAVGVQSVLDGRSDLFQMEYPCHSPAEDRWFIARVTPLRAEQAGAVVAHTNITDRKLVEFQLARLAATDPLTELPNRRFFLDAARRELERLRRFAVPCSILMIDLDHFKAINDTYGHPAGDSCLKHCAATLSGRLRSFDVIARLGGEEFAVVLPGTGEAGAQSVADHLCRLLAASPVEVDDMRIRLTASFGVAEFDAGDSGVEDGLLRADRALYAAKRAGRNRVLAFSSIPPVDETR